ncbi:LAGLIDADG family homing endonuclease [Thermococcus sp. SY098]|uniref:LAGLIDADG family homing endonuclease n=1 Tax=Thermococcus sp. SY098 TaxID=3111325 RepID=UPI002D779F69|nr:LAGLIDADG family homing endonuclease [Thermococcus sp. SY098]WRS53052.1 LAGLIDADG family homing endonuclease [Thermococcus sp. SY098]
MRKLKDLNQEELYEIMECASELRTNGLSYSEISKAIAKNKNVRISKATIIRWCNGIHNPFNRIKEVNLKPSPDLSYVIGVYFGDASVNADKRYRYRIRLKVIDREFAKEFAKALKSLGLNPRLYYENDSTRSGRWSVEATSKELYLFLIRPREVLFDIAKLYPREFLRGFFDSEGYVFVDKHNPRRAYVSVSNYDRDVLEFCQKLLDNLEIHSQIWIMRKAGAPSIIRGEQYFYKENFYELRIYRVESVRNFAFNIGFTIRRKQIKLNNFLKTS